MSRYLRNNIVSNKSEDWFGHSTLSEEIIQIIDSTEPPINIGVFGHWGIGKSSVIEMVKSSLDNESFSIAQVNVWKYENEISLRRKFIYEIARSLGFESEINDLYEKKVLGQDKLFFEKIEKILSGSRTNRLLKFIRAYYFPLLLFLFVIGLIIAQVAQAFQILTWVGAFGVSSVTIFILTLVFDIYKAITNSKSVVERGPFESEEQFEHSFIDMLERNINESGKKTIIVIDDLDRCSSSKVIRTLETIKTFLNVKGCYFIIACDPQIIKKAVIESNRSLKYTEQDGSYYLEKFFNHIIHVPPVLPPNMRMFLRDLLKKQKIDILEDEIIKSNIDNIVYVLAYENTTNPRKVITLANSFISDYYVASRKENFSSEFTDGNRTAIPKNLLTNHPMIIAVMVVIKQNFPFLFDELLKYPNLISSIIEEDFTDLDPSTQLIFNLKFRNQFPDDKFIGEFGATKSEILRGLPDKADVIGLSKFLKQNHAWLTQNLTPFIYLNMDDVELGIGQGDDYRDVVRSLRNGDYEYLLNQLQKLENEDDENNE